jgi:hypothetical protein
LATFLFAGIVRFQGLAQKKMEFRFLEETPVVSEQQDRRRTPFRQSFAFLLWLA